MACFVGLLLQDVASAEVVSPSVHWGAFGYPDQHRVLTLDFTVNRFTVFGSAPRRYDSTVNETLGLNFITMSWTEKWAALGGISTNLTVGGGQTRDQPSHAIQDAIHDQFLIHRVPVGLVREANDFMVDGSATKWWPLLGNPDTFFISAGGSTGSIYHELFARAGVRRAPFSDSLTFIRWSGMGRLSALFNSSALPQVASHSLLGQGSVAIGDYTSTGEVRTIELEIGLTIDSGIFISRAGSTNEEHFGAVALRFPWLTLEMWNDSWAPPKWGRKDEGPTGGGRFMLDLLKISSAVTGFFH